MIYWDEIIKVPTHSLRGRRGSGRGLQVVDDLSRRLYIPLSSMYIDMY